ncbi:NAD(P)-dependent oxidoreductase [Candidatus Uhrbacteria bacterium]|nr:NAD(P)-dependent oxidoreductase [Candidatus Uhrbacteria bacterium]
MRVLLTGSTGFVGRHLVPRLERAGHEIIRLVRTSQGATHEVVWGCHDPLPKLPPCDAIVHLAAHVDFQTQVDLTLFRTNVVSTMRLAAFARSQGAYFILASMVGVHGDAVEIDTMTPVDPVSGYAMSKYLAEEVVQISVDRYSILRIGGIYGLDGPAHLGLNVALSRAYHAGEAPVLRGSGTARRNYICVEDVARWIETILTRVAASGACREVLYLAGSETLTIAGYLETIASILLPENSVQRIEGGEATDCVVVPSAVPFQLHTFAAYVTLLQRTRTASRAARMISGIRVV